jgi:hypothetical protein
MACGYAKFTGKLGVCVRHRGLAAYTCSMACTMPRWTERPCCLSRVCPFTT